MYQALYRKWRPQTFDDVIGQHHITEPLKKQVMTGRLSHAYIFIGTRGTGKTTCARILAKAVNCEQPVNGNPCGKCPACLAIANGEVMDIVELDAASNNSVDNVRALREEAIFSPTQAKKRVYIIDEVHMLSGSAFNALLKILEEPPEHLIFILATTELQKVPATILSRCQRHSFRRINQNILSEYLLQIADKECIALTKNGAELIAGLAEGGVRDALSMLDQCSAYESIDTEEIYSSVGLAGNKRTMQLFELICRHDTEGAIRLFDSVWMDGRDPASFLRELSSLVRDILLVKVAPMGAGGLIYGGFERATMKAYADQYQADQLSRMLEKIQQSLGSMRDMLSPKITAELCIITLCSNMAGDTLKGLNARMNKLERAVYSGEVTITGTGSESALPHENVGTAVVPDGVTVKEKPEPPVHPTKAGEEVSSVSAEQGKTEEAAAIRNNSASCVADEEKPASVSEEHRPVEIQESSLSNPEGPEDPEIGKDTEDTESQSFPAYENSGNVPDIWSRICENVAGSLPPDCQSNLTKVQGRLTENILTLYTTFFVANRFNKPAILDKFAAAASLVTGKNITVKIQVKQEESGGRDINELRRFKEVTFLDNK